MKSFFKFFIVFLLISLFFLAPANAQYSNNWVKFYNGEAFLFETDPGFYNFTPSVNSSQSSSNYGSSSVACLWAYYDSGFAQRQKDFYGNPDPLEEFAIKSGYVSYLSDKQFQIMDLTRSSSCYNSGVYKSVTPSSDSSSNCVVDSSKPNFGFDFNFLDSVVKLLPEVPEHLRLQNIIDNIFGNGNLISIAIRECFIAGWHILLIIALIKIYKLVPFKFT